jgi:hypothetical protein
MFRYLLQHPQFFGGLNKELHFFDYRYEKGASWYQAMFPLERDLPVGAITGEATPFYLFHPLVPARVAEILPKVKLLVLLRNPVDRAISHYYHAVRRGREKRPIMQALDEEQMLIGPEKARLANAEIFKPEQFRRYSYTERGLYAEQLERWFRYFPRDQFFIRPSESFYSGGAQFMRDVFAFLEIDADFVVPDVTPSNVGIDRSDDPEVVARLESYFAPHNHRLEALLGGSYGWFGQTPLPQGEPAR